MNNLTKAALVMAVCIAGCGNPADKFVGHYGGKVDLMPSMVKRLSGLPPEQAAQVRSTMENLTVDLDLQKDKSYAMSLGGPGGKFTITGTWEFTNNTITLINKAATKDGQAVQLPGNSADILSPGGDPNVLKMGAASNPALRRLMITFTKGS